MTATAPEWVYILGAVGSVSTAGAFIVGFASLTAQFRQFRQQRLTSAVTRARRALFVVHQVAEHKGYTWSYFEADWPRDWDEIIDAFRDARAESAATDLEHVRDLAFTLAVCISMEQDARKDFAAAKSGGSLPLQAAQEGWAQAKQELRDALEPVVPACDKARKSVDQTYRRLSALDIGVRRNTLR